MANSHSKGKVLKFTPILKGSDAQAKKIGRKGPSPYKVTLFLLDIVAALLAFGLGSWITGLSYFVMTDFSQLLVLFVLSLLTIAFFPSYQLYSYHRIFSGKEHLMTLIKSFGWSLLSLGIIACLLLWQDLFENRYALPMIFLAAMVLMILSRFLWDQLLNLLKAVGTAFLAIGLIALVSPDEEPILLTNLLTLLMGYSLAVGMILLTRYVLVQEIFNRLMRKHFRRQVIIVGSDQEAEEIAKHIIVRNAPFWVAGFVGADEACSMDLPVPKDRLCELSELPRIVTQEKIDEIIVTDEGMDKTVLISLLDYSTSEGLSIWFPPKLMPIIDLKLRIEDFCGLPMIRLGSQRNSTIFNKIKHGLDALLVLPMLLLLLPVFLVIGIAIKLNSPGTVFYRARAVGRDGKTFNMYKFRSMLPESDSETHKTYVLKLINGEIREESGTGGVFKITADQRVTSVGKFLRKLSLDELPQVINVLKGEMSLVGPRPCLPYEYEAYKDWHKKRLSIRPGITGVWQVAGRSAVSFEDMILLDLYYIYNRSLLMDMNVIYETIFTVLGKRGAY